jgi:hypothetical protein
MTEELGEEEEVWLYAAALLVLLAEQVVLVGIYLSYHHIET